MLIVFEGLSRVVNGALIALPLDHVRSRGCNVVQPHGRECFSRNKIHQIVGDAEEGGHRQC